MFDFLYPWYAAGISLIAIPLIIHFISYRKIRIVDFSAVYFLYELSKKRISRYSMKNLLLLLLRCLIIILVSLAFSAPQYFSGAVSFRQDSAIVFIIDNSCSMRYQTPDGTLMQRARKKLSEILDSLTGREDFTIVTTSPAELCFQTLISDAHEAQKVLDTIHATLYQADFSNACILAEKILTESRKKHLEICILSDFQKSCHIPDLSEKGISIRTVEIRPELITNYAVTAITVNGAFVTGRRIQVSAEISNYSDHNVENHPVLLSVNGETIQQKKITLQAHSKDSVQFDVMLKNTGFIRAFVKTGEDQLSEDNVRHFCYFVRPPLNPLIISRNHSKNSNAFFTSYALNPSYSSSNSIIPTPVEDTEIPASTSVFDMLIICDCELTGRMYSLTESFIKQKKGVVFFSWPDMEPDKYNRILEKCGTDIRVEHIAEASGNQVYRMYPDYSASLFHNFTIQPEYIDASFIQFAALKAPPEMVCSTFNNIFTAVAYDHIQKIMVFGFSLDRRWSDFAASPWFVALIHETLMQMTDYGLCPNTDIALQYNIPLPFSWYVEGKKAQITAPDFHKTEISAEKNPDGAYAGYVPEIPGAYSISGIAEGFSANISADEGDYTLAEIQKTVVKVENTVDSTGGEIRQLAVPLAIMAFILLAAELWYSSKISGKNV